MDQKIIIKTHPGPFHADDVFGVTVLIELVERTGGTFEVIRTRDAEVNADFLVDVGFEYDPERGLFDHHQDGGAGYRNTSSGEPYASFGMIWKEFGPSLCGSERAANLVDYRIVRHVDAVDCGIATGAGYSISSAVEAFNPCWNNGGGHDEAFMVACEFARSLLCREINRAVSAVKAERKVRRAVAKSRKSGLRRDIAVLDIFMPWKSVIPREYPEISMVVFPDETSDWVAYAAPIKGTSRNKISMPREWGGRTSLELDAISGVPGSVFCHKNRFMAVHKTKEGAIQLAEKVIEAAAN